MCFEKCFKKNAVLYAGVFAISQVCFVQSAFAGYIIDWGHYGCPATPPAGNDYISIAAGWSHSLAIRSDGSIVGWGNNYAGQATPPAGNNYIAVVGGQGHSLALRSDGSIVAWGSNYSSPAGNNYIAIDAGQAYSLALRSDGSIVAWGSNYSSPAGNNYIAIAAGEGHSLALRSDGSIVGWGNNSWGQTTPPAGNNYIAISTGWCHSLALCSDGSIVGWGANNAGQATPPAGNDYIAIAAEENWSLALRADGTLVAWGDNWGGQINVPAGNNYVAIAAGEGHGLALYVPGIITVDDDGPADYSTIQAAIDAAYDGDEIVVADGTYTGPGNHNIDFKGKAITVRSGNGPQNCIIDCQSSGWPDRRCGFFFHSGEIENSLLDGFTIINGYYISSPVYPPGGGGIRCEQSSPTLKNNIIKRCFGWAGGGISCVQSSAIIINNRIEDNGYTSPPVCIGAAIFCYQSDPLVMNNVVNGNQAETFGGGMAFWKCSATLINNLIVGNHTSDGNGGGIHCRNSSLTVINNTIAQNRCSGTGWGIPEGGGAIMAVASSVAVSNSVIWDNFSLHGDDDQIASGEYDWLPPEQALGFSFELRPAYVTVQYSDIDGGYEGISNIDADPMFVGPGYWDWDPSFHWVPGDYHLSTSSACIDAGDNAVVPPEVATDLDGNPRIANGTVDMGVYEFFALEVVIDIKPGSYRNSINPDSHGLVPVAILSSGEFDATTVDPETVELAGAGVEMRGKSKKYMAHEEDVNDDGLVDLVLQVATQNFEPGAFQDGFCVLTGSTYDGQDIEGVDEVTIVPPEQ